MRFKHDGWVKLSFFSSHKQMRAWCIIDFLLKPAPFYFFSAPPWKIQKTWRRSSMLNAVLLLSWQTWLQFTITLILMPSKRAILCFSAASCLLWVVLPLLAASVHLFLPTSLWPSSSGLWAAEYFHLLSLLLPHSFLRFLPNIMLLFFKEKTIQTRCLHCKLNKCWLRSAQVDIFCKVGLFLQLGNILCWHVCSLLFQFHSTCQSISE